MSDPAAEWDSGLEHAALSDIGLRRANNQDDYVVALAGSGARWRQRGHLFMVADGMGAHAAGEMASKLATDVVSLAYTKQSDQPPPEALRSAIIEANREIHNRGQADEDFRGMGTTCTTLVLLPEGAVVGQVGDSRAYRLRGDRLEQLSFDHSLVWEMREAGSFGDDEDPPHIPKNVITRSLGPNAEVQVDLEGPFPIALGDTFLLCSDGLSGPVEDVELGTILRCLPPEEAVRALIDLACLRGGPDNITAIAVRAARQPSQADSTPTPYQSRSSGRPVHPLIWTILGVLAAGSAGLLALGHLVPALLTGVGAAATAIIGLAQRYGGSGSDSDFSRRPLGRGPYTHCDCKPNGEFVARLAGLAQELREAAEQQNSQIDWDRFNALSEEAETATRGEKHVEAVRAYCKLITTVMDELRHQGDGGLPHTDDSTSVL